MRSVNLISDVNEYITCMHLNFKNIITRDVLTDIYRSMVL